MYSALLPGLRNLRASLLTGGILLGSLYILFGYSQSRNLEIHPAALEIIHFLPIMPALLVALMCILVGSLYMTGLEGIVDWIHRKHLFYSYNGKETLIQRRVIEALLPFSNSARKRIDFEASRFYDEYSKYLMHQSDDKLISKEQFVKNVLSEILWLEGKLVGTPLEGPYDQFRSEGELRLGTALLLPIASGAAGHALHFGTFEAIILIIVFCVLAIRLADYGLYYFRRAHSFMAHHVADGTVFAPSMETLKRMADQIKQENST